MPSDPYRASREVGRLRRVEPPTTILPVRLDGDGLGRSNEARRAEPPVPKLGSRIVGEIPLSRTNSGTAPRNVEPATTIFPSGWRQAARAWATSRPPVWSPFLRHRTWGRAILAHTGPGRTTDENRGVAHGNDLPSDWRTNASGTGSVAT